MNFAVNIAATGPIFSSGAKLVAEAKLGVAVQGATDYLAGAIRVAAPGATGKMRAGVKVVGVGTGRGVRVQEWYAIPIESGQKPKGLSRTGVDQVALWAQVVLGLSEKEARRFAYAWNRWKLRHSVPRNRFFYGTYDRLAPYLQTHYLGQVGIEIVKALQ